MLRVWVFGHSNRSTFAAHESMPFKLTGSGEYKINTTDTTKPLLHTRYINRLKQVITEADNNGQTVLLSLFDHVPIRTTGGPYDENPWNPNNNNMNCTDGSQMPPSGNGGAAFYNICATAPTGNICTNLTCLGKAQQNLVNRIMTVVKTGNTNNTNFKNVIIEVGNEAIQVSGVSLNAYLTWYKTVASWVKAYGKYMVSVNPGPDSNGTTKYFQ